MSDSKWNTNIKEGYRTCVTQCGNVTVVTHRPTTLSNEEMRKREDQIRTSMMGLIAEKDDHIQEKTA